MRGRSVVDYVQDQFGGVDGVNAAETIFLRSSLSNVAVDVGKCLAQLVERHVTQVLDLVRLLVGPESDVQVGRGDAVVAFGMEQDVEVLQIFS